MKHPQPIITRAREGKPLSTQNRHRNDNTTRALIAFVTLSVTIAALVALSTLL